MEKEIKYLLLKTRVHFFESESKDGLFTSQHIKYNCELANEKGSYLFTYQCNPKYTKVTKDNLLSCVLSDARCYEDCLVGDDEDNINEFYNLFGYGNIKDCLKAFKGCKNAYKSLNKMYTKEEQDLLYEYYFEKGLI